LLADDQAGGRGPQVENRWIKQSSSQINF